MGIREAKAAHEKWLKSRGLHKDQIAKRKKKDRNERKPALSSSYYEDKPFVGSPVLKSAGKIETCSFLETEKFKIEEGLRTSPRDLGSEREYDYQK